MVVPLLLEETAAAKPAAIATAVTVPTTPRPAIAPARPPVVAPVAPATVAFTGTGAGCAITDVDVAATNAIIDTILNVLFMCKSYVPTCPIPDDHIAPRRSALFLARSVLEAARDGESDAHQTA